MNRAEQKVVEAACRWWSFSETSKLQSELSNKCSKIVPRPVPLDSPEWRDHKRAVKAVKALRLCVEEYMTGRVEDDLLELTGHTTTPAPV